MESAASLPHAPRRSARLAASGPQTGYVSPSRGGRHAKKPRAQAASSGEGPPDSVWPAELTIQPVGHILSFVEDSQLLVCVVPHVSR